MLCALRLWRTPLCSGVFICHVTMHSLCRFVACYHADKRVVRWLANLLVAPWEARGPVDTSAPLHAPVLIVDDDEDIRATLRIVAEDAGYKVVDVSSIRDALNHLRAATTGHVVLLDFLLPPENADVLLSAVENDKALRRHRFVLMPANPPTRFSHEAQRLIAAWCSEVVTKPFELAAILASIQRAEAQLSQ